MGVIELGVDDAAGVNLGDGIGYISPVIFTLTGQRKGGICFYIGIDIHSGWSDGSME